VFDPRYVPIVDDPDANIAMAPIRLRAKECHHLAPDFRNSIDHGDKDYGNSENCSN
jgi:hypothetical protein